MSVRLNDITRLAENGLINDRILNFYLSLIKLRSTDTSRKIIVLDTNFYPKLLQRGFNGILGGPIDAATINEIFHPSTHTVLIPIHLYQEQHWTLVAVSMKERTIWLYDSLPGNRHQIVKDVLNYLKDAYFFSYGTPLNLKQWDNKLPDIPVQTNAVDCGVFVMQFAENISRGAAHSFNQAEIPQIRLRILFEILHKKILC